MDKQINFWIFPKIPGKTTRNAVLGGKFTMFSVGIKQE